MKFHKALSSSACRILNRIAPRILLFGTVNLESDHSIHDILGKCFLFKFRDQRFERTCSAEQIRFDQQQILVCFLCLLHAADHIQRQRSAVDRLPGVARVIA